MLLQQKGAYLKFWLILLMTASLPLWLSPASASAEDSLSAGEAAEENQLEAVPCKELKRFNNLDELLYQFYVNFDSDCLFTMPVAELEEIWGITILDEERKKPQNFYPLSETEFYNKPYKSERDAFYVEVGPAIYTSDDRMSFYIKITKAYYEKHGTLFPDGEFSPWLSEAVRKIPEDDDYFFKMFEGGYFFGRLNLSRKEILIPYGIFNGYPGITRIQIW